MVVVCGTGSSELGAARSPPAAGLGGPEATERSGVVAARGWSGLLRGAATGGVAEGRGVATGVASTEAGGGAPLGEAEGCGATEGRGAGSASADDGLLGGAEDLSAENGRGVAIGVTTAEGGTSGAAEGGGSPGATRTARVATPVGPAEAALGVTTADLDPTCGVGETEAGGGAAGAARGRDAEGLTGIGLCLGLPKAKPWGAVLAVGLGATLEGADATLLGAAEPRTEAGAADP